LRGLFRERRCALEVSPAQQLLRDLDSCWDVLRRSPELELEFLDALVWTIAKQVQAVDVVDVGRVRIRGHELRECPFGLVFHPPHPENGRLSRQPYHFTVGG